MLEDICAACVHCWGGEEALLSKAALLCNHKLLVVVTGANTYLKFSWTLLKLFTHNNPSCDKGTQEGLAGWHCTEEEAALSLLC